LANDNGARSRLRTAAGAENVSALKIVMTDLARASIALAMFVFLLGATPPAAADGYSVAQQAGSLGSLYASLCGGGHAPAPLACHAPNGCCRPDQAILPPRTPSPEPAFARVATFAYAIVAPVAPPSGASAAFRSRAPPV
jgi:hypothetical protein